LASYKCPVCGKSLSKREYDRVLRIEKAREDSIRRREEALAKKEKELPSKIRAARIAAARAAQQKEKGRAQRLMQGQRTTIRRLEERVRQLEKGSTPQTEGLEFEDKLVARLRKEFPSDEIRPTGRDGDILHTVKSGAQPAGMIVYECKRTPGIKSAHIHQAHLAKQTREAYFAVVVTTGKKRGFTGLARMHDVLVVSPLGAIPLAGLLREHIIEMLKARLTKEERIRVAERLTGYITSPQFKNPIDEVVSRSSQLQTMIRDEAKQHWNIWKKRWEHYQRIHWDASHIRQNVQLVLAGKSAQPSVPAKAQPLQLPQFAGKRI